jgi:V/A-type H+-transporting ATPase subunit G/H
VEIINIGGETMAKETVEAVRQAEINAAKLEYEATMNKEEMIQKALEDAKSLLSTCMKEALATSAKELEQTSIANDNLMKEAVLRAEQEINILKELVKSKEEAATLLVLGEVI